jgi:hypothetical protein
MEEVDLESIYNSSFPKELQFNLLMCTYYHSLLLEMLGNFMENSGLEKNFSFESNSENLLRLFGKVKEFERHALRVCKKREFSENFKKTESLIKPSKKKKIKNYYYFFLTSYVFMAERKFQENSRISCKILSK